VTPPTVHARWKAPVPLALASFAVAWGIFVIGLTSPLTPSEGRPTTLSLAAFVRLPVALFGAAGANSRERWLKISAVVQIVCVIVVCSYLVALTWR
jgi:hypothetical protein